MSCSPGAAGALERYANLLKCCTGLPLGWPWSRLAAVHVGVASSTLARLSAPERDTRLAATGIALAALLLLGRQVCRILVGAFLANLWTAGSVATSLGIAVGNTSEAVAGAWLVERFAKAAAPSKGRGHLQVRRPRPRS
jgi:hypothetical protein